MNVADLKTLEKGGRFDAAAYLCGYALEMALKACVCRRLRLNEYPEGDLQGRFRTHDIEDLLLLAGLKDEVSAKQHRNLQNWSVVSGWKPDWRYRPSGSVKQGLVQDMIRVLDREVLPWLKKRW